MSILTTSQVATKVEFEFTSGAWTDVTTAYIDNLSALKFRRGVGPDRRPYTSTASFNLDNSTEVWTPGNTSSTYFNKLVKGIGVRISTTYSAVVRYHFRGVVTDVRQTFPQYGPAGLRTSVSCEGLVSLLAKYRDYPMALQSGADVDDVLTAIMTAVASSQYSFEDSAIILPFVLPRGSALEDLVAVAACEMGGILFEDGQGRLRFKAAASMLGGGSGYASPAHTWGSTISPEGDIVPDYRSDAQYARQTVALSVLTPSVTDGVELYRHSLARPGKPEPIQPNETRLIAGQFAKAPVTVYTQFSQQIAGSTDTGDDLGVAMDASTTTCQTSAAVYGPTTFAVGSQIRIEDEHMTVTAIGTKPYGQVLTVTRGVNGSVAAAHGLNMPSGNPIYMRFPETQQADVGFLKNFISSSATSITVTGTAQTINKMAVNAILSIDGEWMKITAVSGPFSGFDMVLTVTRNQPGGLAATSHLANARAYIVAVAYAADIYGPSHIKASSEADGVPGDNRNVVGNPSMPGGAHIRYTGSRFVAAIYNNGASVAYPTEVVIGGSTAELADVPVNITYERAIPTVLGVPEGPTLPLPFGVTDIEAAKGYAVGALLSARVPQGWLPLTFSVSASDNTLSMLTAEIGDLVRYTGTGTNREKIDDWFRIVSVGGDLDGDEMWHFSFLLAPAHLWRNSTKCWFTDFSRVGPMSGGITGQAALFLVTPVGGGAFSSPATGITATWQVSWPATTGLVTAANIMGALGADPTANIVDVGVADMVVNAGVDFGTPAANTYPVNASRGGIGVWFRGNAGLTQYWIAFFNRTTNSVYLYNTTDGVVATYTWTPTGTPEIEVRCQDTRIQVFIDCQPEPVITTTSTRFQTQTYAGVDMNRTIVSGGGVYPAFTYFAAQGL